MVARTALRSFAFAVELRSGRSGRIGSVLKRHADHLIDRGARYVCAYESIVDPECVLVIVGIRTEQPLLSLLRSPYLFAWFHAVGIPDPTKGSRE